MSNLAITYIGHSTTIIHVDGLNIYTDPHFGRKALWLKRKRPLPVPPEDLPAPDAIIISHAHYDHLDLHSFKYFSSRVPVLIPHGLSLFLGRFIRNPVIELAPGADYRLKDRVTIRAIPVQHRGGRIFGLRLREATGYLVKGVSENVFFPGDTAYRPDFVEMKRHGPLAAAMLPIGPIYPKWLMRRRHLDPDQAIRLGEELAPATLIPIHWGQFHLGLEGADTPLHWLKKRLPDSSVADRFVILEPGQKWES